MLRATTACTFSTSQLPRVVRAWCVLYILTWKCASRHNGVQLFISPLASWLRTRRFSEPTFRPSGATNHWKNTVNRDFPTFSRISIFSYSFSSTLLSSDLSLLSASALLCFSSVHIVGNLCIYIYMCVCVCVYMPCVCVCLCVSIKYGSMSSMCIFLFTSNRSEAPHVHVYVCQNGRLSSSAMLGLKFSL